MMPDPTNLHMNNEESPGLFPNRFHVESIDVSDRRPRLGCLRCAGSAVTGRAGSIL